MKGDEHDALEVRRVEALESIGAELRSSRSRREDDERRTRLQQGVDAVAGTPRAPLFAGESAQRLLMCSLPGYASLWEQQVPSDHVTAVCDVHERQEWPIVRCTCGVSTTLERFAPRECEGACGRWFLALGETVRVKRFEQAVT